MVASENESKSQDAESDNTKDEDDGDWWKVKSICFTLSLPRVISQLERLMGSSTVFITDRNYMVELRRRINEVFMIDLTERIRLRKRAEIGRQMKLLLRGYYNERNCPKEMILVHSMTLAEELEPVSRLLKMQPNIPNCPKELRNHPVLKINQSTNQFNAKRRENLFTDRDRATDKLLRLVSFRETQNVQWEERERRREQLQQNKEKAVIESDLRHLKNVENFRYDIKCFKENEMSMVRFLANRKESLLRRMMRPELIHKPIDRSLDIIKQKQILREQCINKLEKIIDKFHNKNRRSTVNSIESKSSKVTVKSQNRESLNLKTRSKSVDEKSFKSMETKSVSSQKSPSPKSKASKNSEKLNVTNQHYVNPLMANFKTADKALNMYDLAEKIVNTGHKQLTVTINPNKSS